MRNVDKIFTHYILLSVFQFKNQSMWYFKWYDLCSFGSTQYFHAMYIINIYQTNQLNKALNVYDIFI